MAEEQRLQPSERVLSAVDSNLDHLRQRDMNTERCYHIHKSTCTCTCKGVGNSKRLDTEIEYMYMQGVWAIVKG